MKTEKRGEAKLEDCEEIQQTKDGWVKEIRKNQYLCKFIYKKTIKRYFYTIEGKDYFMCSHAYEDGKRCMETMEEKLFSLIKG